MTRRKIIKLLGLGLLSLARPGNADTWIGLEPGKVRRMTKGSRVMLGNVRVTIKVFSPKKRQAEEAIAAAFSEAVRLENRLSIFKPESDFSQVNAAAGKHAVQVSSDVMEVLRWGMEVTRITEGAFNMAVGPAMDLWGFIDKKHIPNQKERSSLEALMHPENIVVEEKLQTVFLGEKGMKIDAGGIGKGFIAERMKAVLKDFGVTSGIIAIAGDIALFGTKPNGNPWRIGIQHPRHKEKTIAEIDLSDRFISTSGDYERFFTKNGKIYHHILNSETLLPARNCQSVTVISDNGAFSDALSTGIFVMGPKHGMSLLEKWLGEGVIIDREGRVSVTPSLEGRVRLHEDV
ncbi:MAG: FAD:protein FMN transferase [Nitrospiria bacterium]